MDKTKRKVQKVADNGGSTPLAQLEATLELADKMEEVAKAISSMPKTLSVDGVKTIELKGDKGEDGKNGTDGKDGANGLDGTNGKDGLNGKDGKNGLDGKDGIDGKDGTNGENGKDGSPDTAEQVRDKLETLKGDERFDSKYIKGIEQYSTKIDLNSEIQRALSILDQRTQYLINKVTPAGTSSGSGTVGPGTTNEIAYFNSTTTVASLSTTTYPSLTELSYVKGVTSSIQDQIDALSGSTLAGVSVLSDDATKSTYTATSSVPVLFNMVSEQFRIGFSSTKYLSTAVDTNSLVTFSGSASATFNFAKKVGFGLSAAPTYQMELPLGSNYVAWTGNNSIPQPAYVTLRGYLSGNNPQFDIDLFSSGVAAQTYVFTATGITAPGVTVGSSSIASTTITTKGITLITSTGTDPLYTSYLRSGVAELGITGFQGSDGSYQIRLGSGSTNTNFAGGTQVMSASTSTVSFPVGITLSATNIVTDTTTGMKIGTATTQKLGFFNATPVVQPTAMTTQLTTITFSNPGTPDYAIQDLTAGGFGFVTSDEAQTVLSVIANLQTRVGQLETKLQALGLLA